MLFLLPSLEREKFGNPMWILVAMVALFPFEQDPNLAIIRSSVAGTDLTAVKLVGMVGAVWAFLSLAGGQAETPILQTKQGRAFLLFLIIVLIASILRGAWSLVILKISSIIILFPVVFAVIRSEADLRAALKAGAFTMILTFFIAYRAMLRHGGRFGDGLMDGNFLALATLLFVPLPFVFARHETVGWKRKFWFAGGIVLILEVISSGSRGGFLGLVVVLGLLSLRLAKRPMLALAGGAFIVLLAVVLPTTLAERMSGIWLAPDEGGGGAAVSVQQRLDTLRVGLRMVEANPLVGIGLGNFKPLATAYGADEPKMAHNAYLEVAAEVGLPGLAAFLWVFWATFASLRSSTRLMDSMGRRDLTDLGIAFRASLAGWMVSAIFLHAEFDRFLWLVFFFTVAFERIVRSQAIQQTKSRS